MHVEEVIARLHELAEPIERRAAALQAENDRTARFPTGWMQRHVRRQREIGIKALGYDARFLHSLAEQLEELGRGAEYSDGPPPHNADLAIAIAYVCSKVEDRTR